MQRLLSSRITKVFLGMFALAAVTLPAFATPDLWNWTDKSALLPVREGVALSLVSERGGTWLVSDSSHLYKFDGDRLTDLTRELRAKGLLGVSHIFSDSRQWLVTYQPLDRDQPLAYLTDGENWIEATDRFPYAQGGLNAVGHEGVWYVRTYAKANPGNPARWNLYRWYGAQTSPELIQLPLGKLAPLAAGCVKDLANSVLCTGVNTPLHVRGEWYFLGGTSQLKGTEGAVVQSASTHLWKMDGSTWKEVAIPNVKFVSGVWSSEDQALIATSDVTSNPFAADRFWVFDGNTMREVSSQALGAGLLSIDAREIKATWNGSSWVILAGKNMVRFDGQRMTRETPTRDVFTALASNRGGMTVFVGAASEPGLGVATSPLMAKLVMMEEDPAGAPASAPTVTNVAAEVMSAVFGPRVRVTSNPGDGRIGNGKTFVFDAHTADADDVERVDIYVNGARVKSCFDTRCSYSQTYWTQGAQTRRVQLFARAVNRRNFANDSETVTLVVDANSAATAQINGLPVSTPVVSEEAIPASLPWVMDLGTGIAWATWTTPANQTVLTNQPTSFRVAARAAKGLNRVEMWVNGTVKDTCVFDNVVTDIRACAVTFQPSDYPQSSSLFVNARVIDSRSLETWTSGITFRRERSVSSAVATPKTEATGSTGSKGPTGPVFKASAVLKPELPSVLRGDNVTYTVTGQNNIEGLHSIEVTVNGVPKRTCTFGAAVSAVSCDVTVDTGTYQPGSTINFLGRAIDNRGQQTWANAKSVLVRVTEQGPDSNEAPAKAGSGLSTWSWMTPSQESISAQETATYTVGAWAPRGIKSIEMIADGLVRKTCSFGSKGSKECTYTVTTNDFSDEHMVALNARVTDMDGTVGWSDVRMLTVKRSWNPVLNPASYAQVTTNRTGGYVNNDQISFTMRGWSPRGTERMELYVNGKKVFTCPTTNCTWTTPVYTQPTLEYQVRLVDQGGQDAWSGLYGLRKK